MNEKYKEIVTKLYAEILNREPDTVGLENYALLMEETGLTEDEVREGLIKSEEFQVTHASEIKIIKNLYQEILGRDPEPQGLAHYIWHMKKNDLSEQSIKEILLKSAEFTERN